MPNIIVMHGQLSLLAGIQKGKGFPYSLLSAGPGADPGVQGHRVQPTRKFSVS